MISRELWQRLHRLELKSQRLVDDRLAGAYRSAFKGQGMDFEDVRAYAPGDPVATIDWNVTARSREPFVKTFREERERTVLLVVDVSASGRFGSSPGGAKLEQSLELAMLLSLAAVRDGDRIGLVMFSDHVEHYVPPKKGRRHGLRLVRDLAAHRPSGRGTDVDAALTFVRRVQRRRALVLLVSDLLGVEDALETPLERSSRRHEFVALLPTDPAEVAPPPLGLVALEDAESGRRVLVDTSDPHVRDALATAWRAQRAAALRSCRRQQVDAIELHVDGDWFEELRRGLLERARRRPRARRAGRAA